jgi:cell division protein FtsA
MQVLASIDIGSSSIKILVAEVYGDDINCLCAMEEPSRGVKNGLIVEPDETVYAIKKLLKRVEDNLGFKVTKAIVNIPEEEATFKIGTSSVKVDSDDKEISSTDIVHAMQASVKGNIDNHFDLVTVIPIMFKVDDTKTRFPKGMKGDSLSVKSVVVSAPKKDIYIVAKIMEKCGIDIIDIMIDSIGAYYAHKNESTDLATGAVINCGADNLELSIFNKGIIINNLVLHGAGNLVTKDISNVFKISLDSAENLKRNFACAHSKHASKNEIETVVNSEGEKITISQSEISEVVSGRLQQVLNIAKNEINYLTKKEISFIIITGGLSELKDFSYLVESVFGNLASVGKIKVVGARLNSYASAIGMIKYFDYKLKLRSQEFSILSSDDEEVLTRENLKKNNNDSIMSKVFGIFFDN